MTIGDIGAVIDSLEFDEAECWDPAVVVIDDSIIAVAYMGPDLDGWLKTFSIDAAGNISDAPIDELEYDIERGSHCDIAHAIGDYYAIAYMNKAGKGCLITVKIDSAGTITGVISGPWIFSTGNGDHHSLIRITDGIIADAYLETGTSGRVFTAAINANGIIAEAKIDELIFDTGPAMSKKLIHVTENIYAIAYEGPGTDGWLKTFSIDTAGNISDAPIDELEFEPNQGGQVRICHINGNIYGIVSIDGLTDGWLRTVEIDAEGNIGDAVLDAWEYEPINAAGHDLYKIEKNTVAIAWRDPAGNGKILTCAVADDGAINTTPIDTLTFDTVADQIKIAHLKKNIYSVVYVGTDGDGWVKSLDIETPGGRIQEMMMTGLG